MKRANRLLSNPITRRIGTWLLMLVIGAIIRRLTGQKQPKASRKFVKNRVK